MAESEVDRRLLRELEFMGFPTNRATRALYCTGIFFPALFVFSFLPLFVFSFEFELAFSTDDFIMKLMFSGNCNLEAALDWVIEHENDSISDIDQIPLVRLTLTNKIS
jgi:uncharacterized UBP type Zn finger protein